MTQDDVTLIRDSLRAAVNGEPALASDSAEFDALTKALSAAVNASESDMRILGIAATMAMMERQRAVLMSARTIAMIQLVQAKRQ